MKRIIGILIAMFFAAQVAIAAPPANDNFANATVWTATAFGTTVNATAQPGEPAHATVTAQRSVWWTYTATADGLLEINTFSSTIDTTLAIYEGATLDSLVQVAANDNHSATVSQSRVLFAATNGTTYRIAVDGFGGAAGGVRLDIKPVVPPVNDHFAAALALTSGLSATDNKINTGATAEVGEPAHAGQLADLSLWWAWEAPSNGVVTVDTIGSGVDTLLAVYSGSAVDALTGLASNDDGLGLSGASRLSLQVVAGVTYYFAVDAFAGLEGNYTLNLSLDDAPVVPANDQFSSASELPSGISASVPATNQNATFEAGEPIHAGQTSSRTVWWTWTPVTSGTVTLSTVGSTFDTVLAVYAGETVNALTLIAANDDINGNTTQSQLSFAAQAYTTYRIAVGGFESSAGTIQLGFNQIPLPPANDHFAQRVNLGSALENPLVVVNLGATAQLDEPAHGGLAPSKSVWWQWTAPSEQLMLLTLEDSGLLDTRAAVYTGTALTNLTVVAENDDRAPGDVTSVLGFRAIPGTTYYIAIDTNGGTGGEIFATFVPRPRPDNDDFGGSEVIDGNDVVRNGYSFGSSAETGEPSHAGNLPKHSLWWRWTAPEDALYSLSTSSSDFDTTLAVYTGTELEFLTEVESNDNEPNLGQAFSVLYFRAVAGTTYHIALDGANEGEYQLVLAKTGLDITNDQFASRSDLGSAATVQVSGSNLGTTAEVGEPAHRGTNADSSVWWQWTAPATGFTRVSTDGSSIPLRVAVYSGNDLPTIVPVANADSGSNLTGYLFYAQAGTTYALALDGVAGNQGSLVLKVSPGTSPPKPGNDNFAGRQSLPSEALIEVSAGTNLYATAEASEPSHGGASATSSLWYRWVAPYSGSVTLDGSGMAFVPRMAVYRGAALASLTLVAQTSGPGDVQVDFNVTAGITYILAVDVYGTFPAGGEILFTLFYPPPTNDNFANARTLQSPLPATASGLSPQASAESDEPLHGGQFATASVWWKWTAPADGLVKVSTDGSSFDTLLGVYSGTELSSLVHVGGNDNINSTTYSSEVIFQATAGTTYSIAVDGFQAATGLVELSIAEASLPGPPANDAFANATDLGDDRDFLISGISANATPEDHEPAHAGSVAERSVWWRWTAPVSATVDLDLMGSSFDTVLAVYTGADLAGLAEVVANDDADDGTVQSAVHFSATAGTIYYFAVDGYAGATGAVALNLAVNAPVNDLFAQRTRLGNGSFVDVNGSNAGASTEVNEPNHAGLPPSSTIWWTWTARANSAYAIRTSGAQFNTVLAVYTGSSVAGLNLVRGNDNISPTDNSSGVTFNAVAGTVYQIAIGSAVGAGTGTLRLTIQPTTITAPPGNDNFAEAFNLYSGYVHLVAGTNLGATAEAGEPAHAGGIARDSVWWGWTAPFDGNVAISTAGSLIDTKMAVYTGESLPSLALVAQNDDAATGVTHSSVSFAATAGVRYRIAVDGFFSVEGPIVLGLEFEPVAGLRSYAAWVAAHLGPNSPASDYSFTADPNQDGVSNAISFLLGALPNARSPEGLHLEKQGANLIVTYPRGKDVPVGFEVFQASTNMSAWGPLTDPEVSFELIPGGDSLTDTQRVVVPVAHGHRFFRVAVPE